MSDKIVCPIHKIADCSPLLNGCSIPIFLYDERNRWLEWLVSIGYGLDYVSEPDPPCHVEELASAYLAKTWPQGTHNPFNGCDLEEVVWGIQHETGAFCTTDPGIPSIGDDTANTP